MIPRQMESYLKERLPDRTWEHRLEKVNGFAYLEFGPMDIDRLARLGIVVDSLGPRLVVCMWDEESSFEVGGYLVVDNLAMGKPSMGGIRMLPDLTPSTIYNLARGMTLKNAAANLPYGGGKAGIVGGRGLTPEEHNAVVRQFARMLYRYRDIYLPGPDVGTNDADMKIIATENGIDNALSKPSDMGGNRIDELGAAAGGVIIAIEALIKEMSRLKQLDQCANLDIPPTEGQSFLIQGFGAVGANSAEILLKTLPDAIVSGISDQSGYLYDEHGLPIDHLYRLWRECGIVTRPFFQTHLSTIPLTELTTKYGTNPNDLLRESAFCFIPAAPIANYLDTDPDTKPSMTVDRMGHWSVIVEGANTYSPDPNRKLARARMERAVYREKGVLIAPDYLVNSGGVIYAAQEHLIKTPEHLRFPENILGKPDAIEKWLNEHSKELEELAEQRRVAGEKYRNDVIKRNMKELIDLLISDADMLPCEAAEKISVRRIATREGDRKAAEIMEPIPTILASKTVPEAAQTLIQADCSILAVVTDKGNLVGVVTDWDITQATAVGCSDDTPLSEIMSSNVISVTPKDGILTIVRKLENHEISAMPVVEGQKVLGLVSTDLLARRSLLRLLQSQLE